MSTPDPLLPSDKRLWKTDEQLTCLERFALADDREAFFHGEDETTQRLILEALFHLQTNNKAYDKTLQQISSRCKKSSRWTKIFQELDMQGRLKAWGNGKAETKKNVLKYLQEFLNVDLSRHEQDAAYRQRAEELGKQKKTNYPSALEEDVLKTVERKLEASLSSHPDEGLKLSKAVVTAVVNTPKLVKRLSSQCPDSIRAMLHRMTTPLPPSLVALISGQVETDPEMRHQHFSLEQMRELARVAPQVLSKRGFLKQMAEQLLHSVCTDPDCTNPTDEQYSEFLDHMEPLLESAPANANWLRHVCLRTKLRLQRKQNGWVDVRTLAALVRLPWISPLWSTPRDSHLLQGTLRKLHEDVYCDRNVPPIGMRDDVMGEVSKTLMEQWLLDAVMCPNDGGDHHFQDADGLLAGVLPEKTAAILVAKGMLLSGKGDQSHWVAAFKDAGGNFSELSSQVIMRFAPDCKSEFLPGAEVMLKAEVKNCQVLTVKIFEVSAWNYCREMKHNVKADMELEGLGATHSFSMKLPETNPLRCSRVDIPLPQLGKQRGVFIVELLGGGMACRALLRIGRLAAVEDITPAGHLFYLFWEDGVPADGAKVSVEQCVYEQEGARAGCVLVPFADEVQSRTQRSTAVLGCVGSSMSSVMKFDLRKEHYELSAAMAIEPESMWSTVQATAPLIVSARLFLHGMPVPASLLSEAKVTVTTKDADGTSRKQKVLISAQELRGSREWLTLQVPVVLPEHLQHVSTLLEAEMTIAGRRDMTTGKAEVQRLSVQRDWDAGTCHRTSSLFDMHLGRDGSGFVLTVRGRAGEPAVGAHVRILLLCKHYESETRARAFRVVGGVEAEADISKMMQTDGKGCIRLGPLPHISDVSATLIKPPNATRSSEGRDRIVRIWSLSSLLSTEHTHLPTSLTLPAASSEPARIPFVAPEEPSLTLFGVSVNMAPRPVLLGISSSQTAFTRTTVFLADETAPCVQFEPGYVVLKNVPAGLHRLYLSHDTWITVRAVPPPPAAPVPPLLCKPCGTRWLLGRCATHLLQETHPVSLLSLSATASSGVTLRLAGSPAQLASARVTLTLSRFLPPEESQVQPLASLAACARRQPPTSGNMHLMLEPPCEGKMVPERRLSEEVQYVMARRAAAANCPQAMGTLLQPPSLLVHPARRREAHTRKTQLGIYGDDMKVGAAGLDGHAGYFNDGERRCGRQLASAGRATPSVAGPPYLGFVIPPVTVTDLIPSEDGLVTLSTEALAMAAGGMRLEDSGFGIVTAAVLLPSGHVLTKRATVEGGCSVDAAPIVSPITGPGNAGSRGIEERGRQVETRRAVVLEAGAVLPLPNTSHTGAFKCEAYDSLPKVWELVDSLMGIENCSGREEWATFDVASRWHDLPLSKKLAALSEHRCHELHFFIAINDAPLYGKFLRPAVCAKSREEWRFMDAWLALWPVAAATDWDAAAADALVTEWGSPSAHSRLTRVEKLLFAAVADGRRLLCEGTGQASELRDLSLRLSPSQRLRESESNRTMSLRRFMAALLPDEGVKKQEGRPPATGAAPAFRRSRASAAGARLASMRTTGRGPAREKIAYGGDSQGCSGVDREWDAMLEDTVGAAGEEQVETSDEEQVETSDEEDGDWDFVTHGDKGTGEDGGEDWWATVMAARDKAASTGRFQRPGPTVQWVEGGYYRQGTPEGERRQAAPLEPNAFWSDVCLQLALRLEAGQPPFGAPLLSEHLLEVLASNYHRVPSVAGDTAFSRAFMGVAMMALPKNSTCSRIVSPPAMHAGLSSPALVFIKETLKIDDDVEVSRGINIVRCITLPNTGTVTEDPPAVKGPLVAGCVYRYSVIVSSMLPSAVALDVLIPLPEDSMPVAVQHSQLAGGAVHVNLPSYRSERLERLFYFPYALGEEGTAQQFPVTAVSSLGELLACSSGEQPLQVLDRPVLPPPRLDGKFDWKELSQGGSDREVLNFLETGNLNEDGVDLEMVAWRARRSASFATEAAARLRKRRIFCEQISMYALRDGGDEESIRELLAMSPKIVELCGPYVDTPLLQLRPQACGFFHLELWPFINPRVHELPKGGMPSLSSAFDISHDLKSAWGSLLSVIARQRDGPTFHQTLAVVYYMILQGRLTEAHDRLQACATRFSDLEEAQLGAGLSMQRRYMEAWLGLRLPGAQSPNFLARTHALCETYLAPGSAASGDLRWRQLWTQLMDTVAQLQDVLKGNGGIEDGIDGVKANKSLAPLLKANRRDNWQMEVIAEGLEERIEVRLFPMDAEVMFSTNAFAIAGKESEVDWHMSDKELGMFSFIAPCAVVQLEPPGKAGSSRSVVDIRAALPSMKEAEVVMVQLVSGTTTFRLPMHTSTMRVRSDSREGVLYVKKLVTAIAEGSADSNATWQPLSAAYCKVHARYSNHNEAFYKDGYTDCLGRFDYASLTGGQEAMMKVVKMVALVVSDQGCTIIQMDPPREM